jgi:organic hydroperoxide reductase OsmC/OhrA
MTQPSYRSIEESGLPLVFPILPVAMPPSPPPGQIACRVTARALAGMQKEAVVQLAPGGAWRMVCDEGPYLEGTDLAPFPLGFFSAGMQALLLERLADEAERAGLRPGAIVVRQVNRYTMNGSFLRGDAIGGALPVEAVVTFAGMEASREEQAALIARAVRRCPAHAAYAASLQSRFTLPGAPGLPAPPPAIAFEPLRDAAPAPAVEKLDEAPRVSGVEGGVGSSLRAEQKRTLEVESQGVWRGPERPIEIRVALVRPIGSTFLFRAAAPPAGGSEETSGLPSGLAYLAAGIAFCFLTQLGRYARIAKLPLGPYGIVQDNVFTVDPAATSPLDIHVYATLPGDAPVDARERLVAVAERTCFLHASLRTPIEGRVTLG